MFRRSHRFAPLQTFIATQTENHFAMICNSQSQLTKSLPKPSQRCPLAEHPPVGTQQNGSRSATPINLGIFKFLNGLSASPRMSLTGIPRTDRHRTQTGLLANQLPHPSPYVHSNPFQRRMLPALLGKLTAGFIIVLADREEVFKSL